MFKRSRAKIKVAVAMSGGVDSSAAAAILKNQGYDVLGVFFHFWSENIPGKIRDNICCSLESERDAKRVADKLGIKFYTLNLESDFKKFIVDNFLEEYRAGRTPNPCVRCNRYIKMGAALERVRALGADYLATGHYARVKKDLSGQAHLLKAKDTHKDQTYFLYRLTPGQLAHLLFPVGKYTKPQVRKIAAKYSLPTASKIESQEICFIPSGDIIEFLGRYIDMKPGKIIDVENNEVIGTHDGLQKYTIGQRKGIGLPGGPWYVIKLDTKKNVLWVTRQIDLVKSSEMKISNVSWLSGVEPKLPLKVKCRIRYAATEVAATIIKKENDIYFVDFTEPQLAITPGQSAVFWHGQECLGGGVIVYISEASPSTSLGTGEVS